MSSSTPLAAFFAQHRAALVLSSEPTPEQSFVASDIIIQATRMHPNEVARALDELAGAQRPWHADWVQIGTDFLRIEEMNRQQAYEWNQNRIRDGYVGRLNRKEEPTESEMVADWPNWKWARDRFRALAGRLEPRYDEREEEMAMLICKAYREGGSSDDAATWFYSHTKTGPYQIDAEFPTLWDAVIAECNEEAVSPAL